LAGRPGDAITRANAAVPGTTARVDCRVQGSMSEFASGRPRCGGRTIRDRGTGRGNRWSRGGPGEFPCARRRVSAGRKLFRAITRTRLRAAGTLRQPHDNLPRPARQVSGTRQSSATNPAIFRGHRVPVAGPRQSSAQHTATIRDHQARHPRPVRDVAGGNSEALGAGRPNRATGLARRLGEPAVRVRRFPSSGTGCHRIVSPR